MAQSRAGQRIRATAGKAGGVTVHAPTMHPYLGTVRAGSYTLGMSAMAMGKVALGSDLEVVATMTKSWADGLCRRLDIDVRSQGADRVDWTAPHVVMANHQSYLDILALYRALPRCFGMVAKRELFYVPFFRGVMQGLGCVSVDRKRGTASHRALQEAAKKVRAGSTIVIFPEGTRSMGDRILPMKKGPFHLAQAAKVPIVPIGIRGSAGLMSRKGVGITSGAIDVFIGEPLPAAVGSDGAERNAMAARVRAALSELTGLPLAKATEGVEAEG
jgi:1-acyl-sn-glycerol-3-phosphate acyltransferase